ncbi:MAG: O-antigen ligase family protein, partial [Bryobacteraceae bacterium]
MTRAEPLKVPGQNLAFFPAWKQSAVLAAFVIATTLVTVATCAYAAGGLSGGSVIAMSVLASAACLPVLVSTGALLEDSLLFALAFTLSLSIKKHLIFDSDHLGGAIGYRIAISDLVILALIASLLLRNGFNKKLRVEVNKGILLCFSGYSVLALLSTLAGPSLRLGAFQLSAVLQAFLVFLFVSNYIKDLRRLRIFVTALILALALQSSVTIWQVERPGKLDLHFLGAQEEQDGRVVNRSLELPSVDVGTTTMGGEIQHRPTGLLIHPNVLALYLAFSIPLAIGWWLCANSIWLQILTGLVIGVSAAGMYLTLSRSGWAALVFALVAMAGFWWKWKPARLPLWQRFTIVAVFIISLVGLSLHAKKIYLRVTETADEAVSFRKTLTVAALKMVAAHPFLGVGLNSFTEVVENYDSSMMSRIKRYPVHNTVLLEISKTGIFWGIAVVVLWVEVLWQMYRAARLLGAATPRI